MLDLVVIDGKARGIIVRNLITGAIERHPPMPWFLHRRVRNHLHLSTLAVNSNASAAWKAHLREHSFANPCFIPDTPYKQSPA